MKCILIIAFLILAFTSAQAQELPDEPHTKEYFLTVSRDQRSLAWITIGVGSGLAVGGLLVQFWEEVGHSLGDDPSPKPKKTALIIASGGAALTLVSIPLFKSARDYKQKAASLSFGMQSIPVPCLSYGRTSTSVPGMKLRIAL